LIIYAIDYAITLRHIDIDTPLLMTLLIIDIDAFHFTLMPCHYCHYAITPLRHYFTPAIIITPLFR
jgi:hypothetical protein